MIKAFLAGLKEAAADIFNWTWPVFAVMGLTMGIAEFYNFGPFLLMVAFFMMRLGEKWSVAPVATQPHSN